MPLRKYSLQANNDLGTFVNEVLAIWVTHLVCGRPYLTPTPTLGSAFTTFFTVAWSGKANITAAETHK